MTTKPFEEKNTAKHTPGPWQVCEREVRTVAESLHRMPFGIGGESTPNSVTLRRDDSNPPLEWMSTDTICEMDKEDLPEPEQEANACLIAAAPELLKALERIHNQLSCVAGASDDHCVACLAIKKARGQS